MRQTISLPELLTLLGWSRSKFNRLQRNGQLPFAPCERNGAHWQFPKFAVETYLGHMLDLEIILDPGGITEVVEVEDDGIIREVG